MQLSNLMKSLRHPINLSLLIVVAAGYLSVFLLAQEPFSPVELILLVVLGLVYLAFDIWWLDYFEVHNKKIVPYLIFLVVIPLGGAILMLSQGNGWLVLLPLPALAVAYLSRRLAWLANAFILGIVLVNMRMLTDDWTDIAQAMGSFLAAVVFVVAFTQMFLREQNARAEVERLAEELGAANQRLRGYALRVEELAAAQERNRLARDIHDGLGHYLTSINMQIKAAQAVLDADPERAAQAMGKAQTLSQDALAEVRHSVAALRGQPALNAPLPQAIEGLLEPARSAGLVAELKVDGDPRPLPPQTELTVYRAVQEGLTNVRKHALASRVDICLAYLPRSVRLAVQDNGIGFREGEPDAGKGTAGFGLLGLRERIQLLDGKLATHSAPEGGFVLEIEVPG